MKVLLVLEIEVADGRPGSSYAWLPSVAEKVGSFARKLKRVRNVENIQVHNIEAVKLLGLPIPLEINGQPLQ